MSENKAPNAVVVSAQRLQDLRDLCQPSNFNTTEQAHSALHNGISKLLNEVTGLPVNIKRLLPNDRFQINGRDTVYKVFGRFIKVRSSFLLETRRRIDNGIEAERPWTGIEQDEYLEVHVDGGPVMDTLLFVDMTTGKAYGTVGEPKSIRDDLQFGPIVTILTQL